MSDKRDLAINDATLSGVDPSKRPIFAKPDWHNDAVILPRVLETLQKPHIPPSMPRVTPNTETLQKLWREQQDKDKASVQARLAACNPIQMMDDRAPIGDVLRELHKLSEGHEISGTLYLGGHEYKLDADNRLIVDSELGIESVSAEPRFRIIS